MPRTVSSRASIHSVRSVSKTKDPCTRGRDDGDDVAREKTGLDAVLKLGLMRACSAHNAKKIASATAECVTTTPLYARSCKRAPQHRKRLVPSRQEASMSSSSAHPQTHTPRRRIARRGRASRSGASGLRAKARRGAALSSAATSASRRPGSRRGTITSWAVPGLGHPRPSGRREPDGHCFAHASVQIRRRESRSSSSRATGPQPGAPCTRARTCFVHKVLVEVQRVDCEQHQPESNSRPRPERLLPVVRDDGERVPPRHDELHLEGERVHHLKRVGAPLPHQLRHVLLGR